jgi:hypothetical protein
MHAHTLTARVARGTQEMDAQRLELSPIYSQVILKFSTYEKPQQDRMFFESLYETLVSPHVCVLCARTCVRVRVWLLGCL